MSGENILREAEAAAPREELATEPEAEAAADLADPEEAAAVDEAASVTPLENEEYVWQLEEAGVE